VSSGYYKLPDQTKEEYDSEGWFHTGDIGQFTKDGVIQIVDRKKNLIKLKGGEYVAIESMENAFASSPYCSAVCVIANGDLDVPLAFVNANVSKLKEWASKNNVSYDSVSDLCEKDETRKAVVKSMVAAGKEAGLNSLEVRIKDCCLVTKEWGPGHGMTATMKIDRKEICRMHEKELQAMMKRNNVEA
jgi:long-chain acyl-CoA synthetase